MKPQPVFTYSAFVIEVHDGDTITCSVDCGFGIWLRGAKFRLYGMNAPELMNVSPLKGVNKEGKAARDALLSKITEVQPTVRTVFGVPSLVLATPVPVVIVTLKDKGEKYGRWLAKVYATQADGTQLFVNDWMIANNFAVPFMT